METLPVAHCPVKRIPAVTVAPCVSIWTSDVVWCGVVWCGVVWCGVVWCGVVWCGVVWCGVVWCGVVWCGVPKALLPEGNGRDVYPRVQVNGRAVCLSVRCVLVCCCPAGTSAQSHLASAALPTPVHRHTGSSGPTTPCVLRCTIGTLCAVPSVRCRTAWCWALHCIVCALLHCTCGQWAVGCGTYAMHCHTAWGHWAVELLQCTATVPGGSGQWNSCNALPHCLGAVGGISPTMLCLTT